MASGRFDRNDVPPRAVIRIRGHHHPPFTVAISFRSLPILVLIAGEVRLAAL